MTASTKFRSARQRESSRCATGELREYEITPEEFRRYARRAPRSFLTADAAEATELLRRTLEGDAGPAQDVLALNGGAAIYVGGGAETLADGVVRARAISLRARLDTIEQMRAREPRRSFMRASDSGVQRWLDPR